jgi:hypothetical protein
MEGRHICPLSFGGDYDIRLYKPCGCGYNQENRAPTAMAKHELESKQAVQ